MRLFNMVAPKAMLVIAASWPPVLAALHPLGWWTFLIFLYYPIYGLTVWHRWRSIDLRRTNHGNTLGYYQGLSGDDTHEMAMLQADVEGLILDVIFIAAGIGMGVWAIWR